MSQSLDTIAYGAALTTSAVFRFIKINLAGTISTGLVAVLSIIVLTDQCLGGSPGPRHAGGVAVLMVLFSCRPIATLVTIVVLFASPCILFALGNKYILMKAANKVVVDKGERLLYRVMDRVFQGIGSRRPEILVKGMDRAKVELGIIQEIKNANENKWLKRLIIFGMKRIDLHDSDLGDPDLNFSGIIKTRVIRVLQGISKPSRSFFWITIGMQWLTLLLIWLSAP